MAKVCADNKSDRAGWRVWPGAARAEANPTGGGGSGNKNPQVRWHCWRAATRTGADPTKRPRLDKRNSKELEYLQRLRRWSCNVDGEPSGRRLPKLWISMSAFEAADGQLMIF